MSQNKCQRHSKALPWSIPTCVNWNKSQFLFGSLYNKEEIQKHDFKNLPGNKMLIVFLCAKIDTKDAFHLISEVKYKWLQKQVRRIFVCLCHHFSGVRESSK